MTPPEVETESECEMSRPVGEWHENPTVEELADRQGVGPVTDLGALRMPDVSDEEAAAFLAAVNPDPLSDEERRTVEAHRTFIARNERTFPDRLIAIIDRLAPPPVSSRAGEPGPEGEG